MTKGYTIVFLFSGQGSHYRNMGNELFFTDLMFRETIEWADAILLKQTGHSLIYELYETKGLFNNLIITSPAILAVELAMIAVIEKIGIKADLVAGNSLGEFAAGVASGVWSKEQAMLSCIKRTETIVENALPGGMIAVLSERTPELTADISSFGLYLASDNFKGHFTVSGLVENISKFKQYLDSRGIICQLLEVAWPFHSPYMGSVDLTENLSIVPTGLPYKIPMYSSLQGQVITSPIGEDYFWNTVSEPTDFKAMLMKLEKDYGHCLYIDLGPSGTMTNFVKYNLSDESLSVPITLLSPFKGVKSRLEELQEKIENNNLV